MKLYDTLSKEKKSLDKKNLKLFVCGPTVYDFSHIGHARTYVAFDMFVKYLREKKKVKVNYIQNITDIDDKIIQRANETKKGALELAKHFEEEYHKNMESLGITSVSKYQRATDHIPEIISQIKQLIDKKIAYKINGEGVYYDISKFKNYGKLSGRTVLQAEDATSRIDESIGKHNKGDFALWKFSPPSGKIGELEWESPWGKGRPGWHIEDTAITEKYFGPQYDIHGGARDLIFPHHEAEIAQMEAISGKEPLVEYWMHSGFLTIGGEKMSKSLKNFLTIEDALKTYSPQTIRIFFTTKHYRSPIDYTEKGLQEAKANENKIEEFLLNITNNKQLTTKAKQADNKIGEFIEGFWAYLEDDFNTPRAFAELFQLINFVYKENILNQKNKKILKNFLEEINKIFNIVDEKKLKNALNIPPEIIVLADDREKMRNEKNWSNADKIRKKIEELGYEIKDTNSGPKIKKYKT